jgi:lactate 2-monooxygenase
MNDIGPGLARQGEIYLRGLQGERPPLPIDPEALEEKARAAMSAEGFAYVAGGAGREQTTAANRAALERWRIVPRMGRDCSKRDLKVKLLGRELAQPLLVAPIGVLSMAHPEADLAVARAAAARGWPMIVSNQASFSMEEIAEAAPGAPRWSSSTGAAPTNWSPRW